MGANESQAIAPSLALHDPLTKARLAIAGRIASGIGANPNLWDGPDPEGEAARRAWAIAGKLILLAESGGC